ncbi:PorT family protein [Taibaiella lutea]|uniref:PorT family protein n=1 Tax=Taibaiella lutea TaxID=2608001 RepID=A0A5M6CIF3_9BACT|nr:outer membrane beta-barrel protein [Taibaiella lutea]KAA5534978.1 PorT family protein [Taibaiella lutea]
MKVLLRIVTGFLLLTIIFIQPSRAQVRIGPEAGVNFGMQSQNIKAGSSTENRNSTLKVGAIAGVNADIKILSNLYVQTGFFYVYDNVKFKNEVDFIPLSFGNPKQEINDDIHAFRIPLYIMYKSGFDGFGRFITGIGPYIGYSFIANRSISTPILIYDNNGTAVSYYNNKVNYELELGNNPLKDEMRKWDYGVNACIGYESNVGMFFRGYFNYGLQNLTPGGSSDYKLKNWGAGVTIGFNIGKDNW